jgi:ornithine carbamoyltransferase
MADVMTFEERLGAIAGRTIAWCGDGNNMAASWIHAAVRFGFELRLACPEPLSPPREVLDWAARQQGRILVTSDMAEALNGADCVVTDVWVSMGDDDQQPEYRHNLLRSYQIDEAAMALAKPEAIFLHCLPAHRGEEVAASVIDGLQSAVWDEAENRLHAQKGILLWCMT